MRRERPPILRLYGKWENNIAILSAPSIVYRPYGLRREVFFSFKYEKVSGIAEEVGDEKISLFLNYNMNLFNNKVVKTRAMKRAIKNPENGSDSSQCLKTDT